MVRTWFVVAMTLVGCAGAMEPTDEAASATCDPKLDELLGCCAAGASCTWATPIAAECTDEFTSFCAHGLGWCDAGVCRAFCSPVDAQRCEPGTVEHHESNADLGEADLCTCVPG